jgi:hypothetical protein
MSSFRAFVTAFGAVLWQGMLRFRCATGISRPPRPPSMWRKLPGITAGKQPRHFLHCIGLAFAASALSFLSDAAAATEGEDHCAAQAETASTFVDAIAEADYQFIWRHDIQSVQQIKKIQDTNPAFLWESAEESAFNQQDWDKKWQGVRALLDSGLRDVAEARSLSDDTCQIFISVSFPRPSDSPVENLQLLKRLVFRVLVQKERPVITEFARLPVGDEIWDPSPTVEDVIFIHGVIDRGAPFVRDRLARVHDLLQGSESPRAQRLRAKAAYEGGLLDLVMGEFSRQKRAGASVIAELIEQDKSYEAQFFLQDFGFIVGNSANLAVTKELIVEHFDAHPFGGRACHAMTPRYPVSRPDFAPPFDQISPQKPMLVSVRCAWPYSLIEVGTGEDAIVIFGGMYRFVQGAWKRIDLTSPYLHGIGSGERWYRGEAYALLQHQDGEQDEMVYVVAYVCRNVGGDNWKCGCPDERCDRPLWSMQAFSHNTAALAERLKSMPVAPVSPVQ